MSEASVSEVVTDPLPDDIEMLPPGPQLAALLSQVDRRQLSPQQLFQVTRARLRLIASLEAQVWEDLHRVAHTLPDAAPATPDHPRGRPGRRPYAEVETSFALVWTHARAAEQLSYATDLIDRLPAVFDALAAGVIDVPRARVLADGVAALPVEQARRVVDQALTHAGDETTGELRARVRRLALAADPELAGKRARREIQDRKVRAYLNDNNLAALAGYELAPHRVAAAMERLDAITRAAKAAGDTRRADQLRADIFLDLLVGEGIAVDLPITDGAYGYDDPERPDPEGRALDSGDTGSTRPGKTGRGSQGSWDGQRRATARAAAAAPWPSTPADPELLLDVPDGLPIDLADPDPESLWAGETLEPPPLVRADDVGDPDESWLRRCWSIGFGQLTRAGGTAGDHGDRQRPRPAPRAGVVDLIVPLTVLAGLSEQPGLLPEWGAILADLTRRVAFEQQGTQWRYSITNDFGEVVDHGRLRRRPAARDLAFVQARDRRCRAPGCRRRVRACDVDHTSDWARSRDSGRSNLACLCPMHHRYKHDTGAELVQLESGALVWHTRTGQYVTHPWRHDGADVAGATTPPGQSSDPVAVRR